MNLMQAIFNIGGDDAKTKEDAKDRPKGGRRKRPDIIGHRRACKTLRPGLVVLDQAMAEKGDAEQAPAVSDQGSEAADACEQVETKEAKAVEESKALVKVTPQERERLTAEAIEADLKQIPSKVRKYLLEHSGKPLSYLARRLLSDAYFTGKPVTIELAKETLKALSENERALPVGAGTGMSDVAVTDKLECSSCYQGIKMDTTFEWYGGRPYCCQYCVGTQKMREKEAARSAQYGFDDDCPF